MSKYTTGEIARLCGVSVRTVQYYDTRSILIPSEISEGGRRLYSEEDLMRMKIICFLRELDIPINAIGELLSEEDPGSVISILLERQEKLLREELEEREEKLKKLEELKRACDRAEDFSVESIADIATIMENKKKLRKVRAVMLLTGIPIGIIQWTSIILWILKGMWWFFAGYLVIAIPYGIWISRYYFKNAAYICPKCHTVFKPKFKEAFWANHTPTTRKLTCTCCGHKGFCVETAASEITE